MKHLILTVILISLVLYGRSQTIENIMDPEVHLTGRRLPASWIMHPTADFHDYSVILFRKSFELESTPTSFIIHISADNKYRLFVNGKYVAKGPARSDLSHWYYETLDISPLLTNGKNVLAVEVINFGPKRGWSQFSAMTNLFVVGNGEKEQAINTKPGTWQCWHDQAYHPRVVNWLGRVDIASGLYVANPTDSINGNLHPWGWEQPGYDDTKWMPCAWSNNAGLRGYQYAGGIIYSGGKLMVPRPIKLLREKKNRFGTILQQEGIEVANNTFEKKQDLIIPANRKIRLLIDNETLTVGYPEIVVSGGKNSRIKTSYAESFFNASDRSSKGHRDDLNDKVFIGVSDVFIPDGGENRLFRPTWTRSFRFIQLEIETGEDALVINDYYNKFNAYPLSLSATFKSDNEELNDLLEPGWRSTSICAQDLLISDAYYEQMQYVGDSKVYNLAVLYLSGNDDLVRNALTQMDWSRTPEGIGQACYPNPFHLVIPFYSLVWIDMVFDHMMWAGDKEYTKTLETGISAILNWFQGRMNPNGLLGPIEWWRDVDWSPGFPNGEPPGIENGNSALFSLKYAYALEKAASIYRFTGENHIADIYKERADKIKFAVNELCYNEEKGLFAETPEFKDYSQHTNIMAILTETVTGDKAREIMKEVLEDKSLHQVALFFRFYLFEALRKTGMADHLIDELHPWYEMMDMGLTTFTEVPLEWTFQRSDCHPWSTSPNIHYYTTICGIQAEDPGFDRVRIEPELGQLKKVNASFTHPKGIFEFDLNRSGKNGLKGNIVLPDGVTGIFHWGDSEMILKPGKNRIMIN